jgi:hypothetical protein
METTGNACGEPNNTMMVMWNGQKLLYAGINKSMFDAPMYYNEDWIFPNEKDGKPNQIIWISTAGGENEDGTEMKEEKERKVYKWNGSKLVK